MTTAQRTEHRDLYNQLRLAIAWPGDEVADIRRPFQPVNADKWGMTWDELMQCPDTPAIARMRARGDKALLFRIGRYEQVA